MRGHKRNLSCAGIRAKNRRRIRYAMQRTKCAPMAGNARPAKNRKPGPARPNKHTKKRGRTK
jgi:hypothetical protein